MSQLKNVKFGFGTESSPTHVTKTQVETLLSAINDTNLETKSFSGHIQMDEDSITSLQLYELASAGVSYHGDYTPVEFTISASKTTVNEGQTITVSATSSEELDISAYRFKVDNVSVVSGNITSDEFKSLCSFDGNVLTISNSEKNEKWKVTFDIVAWLVFDTETTMSVSITCNGVMKAVNFAIGAPSSVDVINGEPTEISVSISYSPAGCANPDTLPVVSCENDNVTIKDISVRSFTLSFSGTSDYSASVSVTAVGVTKTIGFDVNALKVPTITISGETIFASVEGEGSADYTFVYNPSDYNVPISLVSITSSNNIFSVSDQSMSGFTINTSGVTSKQYISTLITARFNVNGSIVNVTQDIYTSFRKKIIPFIIINPYEHAISFGYSDLDSKTFSFSYAIVNDYVKGSKSTYDFDSVDYYGVVGNGTGTFTLQTGESLLMYSSAASATNLKFNITTTDVEFDGELLGITGMTMVSYGFYRLFQGCTSITKSPELPYTTLAERCYSLMFDGCTSLVTPPELPATNLQEGCYSGMFNDCTSLVNAPYLPSNVMKSSCYWCMFKGCIALKNPPELTATTLNTYCYFKMFENCVSLVLPPSSLPAESLRDSCYEGMFIGCTSLTKAPDMPVDNVGFSSCREMFNGCTSLTQSPELPAKTLGSYCYERMFKDCESLVEAPNLPATIATYNCYCEMFYGCKSLTQAPEISLTFLRPLCCYSMFRECTSLQISPSLKALELADSCYTQMFYGCINLQRVEALFLTTPSSTFTYNWLGAITGVGRTFVRNSQATWENEITRSSSTVPSGWNILTKNV